ncbi:PQQ-dependent sugar dehydrogenase [Brucella anthropi]|uniref:PQQ-dependent sugar dehydrogenase n=1 Tax=Brucella anthropi TaxID=529 RepID=UPI0004A7187C|nr:MULTISPECIES: PQQ-dependent sugar dehydrogenase [Brucella/Ochrobactrum group]KIU68677.1 dehydrogenase [Brucella anthropi]QOD63154.1 PQQ-dependent sugar dehydrogenase [Ochrobactrum sp. MT180101]
MRRAVLSLPFVLAASMVALPVLDVSAESINAGGRKAEASAPFTATSVAEFDTPWAIAFLPDGRLLLTEKGGKIFIVTQSGDKTAVDGVPGVAFSGQNGLLDIALAPDFEKGKAVYFSYNEPAKNGSSVVLVRAVLDEGDGKAALQDKTTIWKQDAAARGGQPGGIIAFAPDGKHLFLSVGDRMLPATAQDDEAPMGKILRMNLDGSVPKDNPHADAGGVRALTWSTGHRNPYGLAFGPDGKLWEHEMGPRGGDEFNLIKPGLNYGWPVVSNGDNYSGRPIPRHSTRPEFEPPLVYWTPVIAPAGLAFYEGDMFPEWRGSALIGGLSVMSLVRVVIDKDGKADEAERFEMENRIRDVAVGPDGAIWLIEDDNPGRLLKLTPKA